MVCAILRSRGGSFAAPPVIMSEPREFASDQDQPVPGAVTDERGVYCLPALPSGRYRLRAVARTAFHLAVMISPAHPRANIDFHLRRGPVYCVTGECRTGESAGVLHPGGRFLLTNLDPGRYTLMLMDRPQFGRILARQEFEVRDHNIEKLALQTSK